MGKTGAEATYTIDGVMTARKAGGKTRTKSEMLALGAQCEGKHAKHKFVCIRQTQHKRSPASSRIHQAGAAGHQPDLFNLTA